jgi:hypothetical protein
MNKISMLSVLFVVGCGKSAYTEDREPAPARAVIVVTEKTKECTRSYTQGETTPPEWTCKEDKKDDKVIVVTDDDILPQQAPVVIIKKKTK